MPTATLSSKYQITIPMEIVRSLGLKPGDKLAVERVEDRVVMLREPANWVDYFRGSLRGVYGETVEEIDRYVAEERASWERDEWKEQFEDLIATDEDARKIVNRLRECPHRTSPEHELWNILGINSATFHEALNKLLNHGAVRKIAARPGIGAYQEMYRLIRDFAGQ